MKVINLIIVVSSKVDGIEIIMLVVILNKKRFGDKVEKVIDDFFYEKFKKRVRDFWRY